MICQKGCRLYLNRNYHHLLGVIHKNQTFIVHVKKPSKHFFRLGQGYPINKELLLYLHENNIHTVLIPELSHHVFMVYEASVQQYLNGGQISLGGYEPQMVIPLNQCKKRLDLKKYKTNIMSLMYPR
ncbi:MAG: hypothetical protein ACOC80_07060 [Petrotogales bacterium]